MVNSSGHKVVLADESFRERKKMGLRAAILALQRKKGFVAARKPCG